MILAEKIIRESLVIARKRIISSDEKIGIMLLAASYDHLGYVLFNRNKADMKQLMEAKALLEKAISNRLLLCNFQPDNIRYFHDLAWSQDNMGCLLTQIVTFLKNGEPTTYSMFINIDNKKLDSIINEAENYLRSALDTREKLAKARENRRTSSEVAWTSCNLAVCLASQNKNDEAESMFKKSIDLYENIERKIPGLETASLAKSFALYGRNLIKIAGREDEGIEKLRNALHLNQTLEKENPGIYQGEIKSISDEIYGFERKKVK